MTGDTFGMRQETTATRLAIAGCLAGVLFCAAVALAQDDVANVRSTEYRLDDTGRLRYRLIGAKEALGKPENGYKLLVVLPGGDGGPDFEPFIKRIYKFALTDEYLVIQLIAPRWNKRQQIVWPTALDSVRGATVSTEEFLADAVDDLEKRNQLDQRHVFTLSWSSGGPAAYAASLAQDTPITGSFVAMSVFKPETLGDLSRAKGKHYYIHHSPDDRVCPFWMARKARDELREHGAIVEFGTYDGGHGWRGNVFGNIRTGIEWLEEQAGQTDDKESSP